MGFFSRAFLVFLMKESKKRRQKQPGELMAKSCSQPVNLPGARPLMNPLPITNTKVMKASKHIENKYQKIKINEKMLKVLINVNISC